MYRIIVKVGNEEIDVFNAYLSVVKDKSFFRGRLDRKTFLGFVLVNFVIYIVYCLLLLLLTNLFLKEADYANGIYLFRPVSYIYAIAMLYPSLNAIVRRLHDIGFSVFKSFLILYLPATLVIAFWGTGIQKYLFQSDPTTYTFFEIFPYAALFSPLLIFLCVIFLPILLVYSPLLFIIAFLYPNLLLKFLSVLLLLIGSLVILCFLPGTEGENKYGDAPEVIEVKSRKSSKVRKDIKS